MDLGFFFCEAFEEDGVLLLFEDEFEELVDAEFGLGVVAGLDDALELDADGVEDLDLFFFVEEFFVVFVVELDEGFEDGEHAVEVWVFGVEDCHGEPGDEGFGFEFLGHAVEGEETGYHFYDADSEGGFAGEFCEEDHEIVGFSVEDFFDEYV